MKYTTTATTTTTITTSTANNKGIWLKNSWSINNLKNGGYSSGTFVPYKI